MYIYIIHKNCIILPFDTLCHIGRNMLNFCFCDLFCFLVRNENNSLLYDINNKGFPDFSTAETTKQNKEYV